MIARLPTVRWREEMREGDDLFTEEGISAVEAVLRNYAVRLGRLAPNARKEDILAAMKTAVIEVNKIGGIEGRFDNFIETSEREELCEYLESLARTAGLELPPGEDPTFEWRDW